MGLRPIKGDENLAEVQLSRTTFDALTGGLVADRVNGKSEAFDRAGGLSGRLLGTRRISRTSPFQYRSSQSRRNNLRELHVQVRQRPERPPEARLPVPGWSTACHAEGRTAPA